MTLDKESCIPCKGGVEALSSEEIASLLSSVPNWQYDEAQHCLIRTWHFKNFKQSLAFVQQVAGIAEAEKHHPDIHFGWGYCDIRLQTHAIGGVHRNDFIVASKINMIEVG